jgi:hypothetical protein
MLFTYKDKGPATVFAYPSNQRPMNKYNSIPNIPGKPNPIKQWRKQIAPSLSKNVIQSHPTLQSLESAVKTDMNLCKSYTDVLYVDTCNGVAGSNPCITGSFNITRSASTIIDKNFCWNSKQYLQSRCKTYDQNQTLGKNTGNDTGNGTKYEYFGASCTTKPDGSACKPIIHKPNNKAFKQQGGVSSSARIAKLKYDTIRTSTNKYDSLLANLDSSSHILNRKPVPCRGWRVNGKRPYSAKCHQPISIDNI